MSDVGGVDDQLARLLGPDVTPRLLTALIDAIVPADDFPSASRAGGLTFLWRVLTGDRREWVDRCRRVLVLVDAASQRRIGASFDAGTDADRTGVLDELSGNRDYRWFASLVTDGYYADPANGGNADGVSWRMLGWRPDPPDGWPPTAGSVTYDRTGMIRRDQLLDRYDAIVIGTGAGGGVAACWLAESGRTVLIVERGDFPDTAFLATDHLRNARTSAGFEDRTGPTAPDDPRTLEVDGRVITLAPTDGRWSNNAMTVGGGTRIYGAQAWRFAPEDFRMASTYGVPEGSALADWPISYADMEPYYCRAEIEIGVSGSAEGDTSGAWRSVDYPMPPLSLTRPGEVLADGARRLGLNTVPVPLLINSEEYGGRPGCARCAQCVGFACPVDAKNGTHNTVLARALATGRASLVTGTRAERLIADVRGRVVAVALVGDVGGSVWRREVAAEEFVVSAGAIESARLLLNSASDREPHGLGNNADQVGRHLQGHVYAGAVGLFADPIHDGVGPGPCIATNDFRHHNDGIVGGGMLANEFVPTPVNTRAYLLGAGLLPLHGLEAKRRLRELAPRMERVMGPIQEVTTASARVRLDPNVVDRFGIPVARLSGSIHPEDQCAQAFMSERAREWLMASGAVEARLMGPRRGAEVRTGTAAMGTRPRSAVAGTPGPSGGQHQAGTVRMGTDPATSAADPWGRIWGHDNVRVVDGSLHVTNGGVNPVLTIFANAMRIMDHMVKGHS